MPKIRYTQKYLTLFENIFQQSGYTLRYEKGNFKSGYCILNSKKVVIVNKYFPVEGKINCLIEIIKTVDWDFSNLLENEKKMYQEVKSSQQLDIEL